MVVGDTERVPPGTGVTAPIPWLIENAVAFVVDHVSVDELPCATVDGFAESAQVGAGTGTTTTVAAQFTVPPEPVAVRV